MTEYEYAIAPPEDNDGVWYMLTPYMQSVGWRLLRRRALLGEEARAAHERTDWEKIGPPPQRERPARHGMGPFASPFPAAISARQKLEDEVRNGTARRRALQGQRCDVNLTGQYARGIQCELPLNHIGPHQVTVRP